VSHTRFFQKFYVQDSASWNGDYTYHRHCFRKEILHRKFLRGVIALTDKRSDMVIEFLKIYTINQYMKKMKLTEDDEEILKNLVIILSKNLIRDKDLK
jgi:hypothetical protein